jgi:hypothetical protein
VRPGEPAGETMCPTPARARGLAPVRGGGQQAGDSGAPDSLSATTTQAPRRLRPALAVIANTQLIVALDVTVADGFRKTEGLT